MMDALCRVHAHNHVARAAPAANATTTAAATAAAHSVVGRPSAGGLHFAEYVVYRGEQVNSIQSLRVQ